MTTIASHSAFTDGAAILARGYLRFTSIAPDFAISRRVEPQKELEVSAGESPHVHGDSSTRRPR